MATNIGKKHTFVGINFDFTNRGSLHLDMIGHLQDALDTFTEELGSTPTSPASDFLFDANPHAKPLSEKDRKMFQSVFARLLYVGKRTRPDIQVAVAFLGTRTLRADVDFFNLDGMCCFGSISCKLQYGSTCGVTSREDDIKIKCITNEVLRYKNRGFTVNIVLIDEN